MPQDAAQTSLGGRMPPLLGARFALLGFQVKLLIFVGMNVFGALGWYAGEQFGIMTAFITGGIGSIIGVYAGWWIARRLLE